MGGTRVELTVSNSTARITLNGPETRNALDAAAAAELRAVCEEIENDPTIGAAIITGTAAAAGVFKIERARQMWSLSRPRKEG